MKKVYVLVSFVLLLIFLTAASWMWFSSHFNDTQKGEVTFYSGTSLNQASSILEDEDIISNATVFTNYIRAKQVYHDFFSDDSFSVSLSEGTYTFESSTFDGVISDFDQDPDPLGEYVTFPEGFSVSQIQDRLIEEDFFTEEEVNSFFSSKETYQNIQDQFDWLPDLTEELTPYEGAIHANTYFVHNNDTIDDLILETIHYTDQIKKEYEDEISSSPLSFFEILTVSSIIEREVNREEDLPKVSQVIQKRLNEGMKLQMDSTANYALDHHQTMMSYDDIDVDSEYNTYNINGLPIGPISSPSRNSLESAISPSETDYLFFYSRPSGETLFTDDYDEHLENREEYRSEWEDLD